MEKLKWETVKPEELITVEELVQEFKNYCMKNLGYDKYEAEIAASDMKDPYNTPYIMQEYEGPYYDGDVEYEVRDCWTDFLRCGLWDLADVKKFRFYMYINTSEMPDETVGSYTKASKKFYVYEDDDE